MSIMEVVTASALKKLSGQKIITPSDYRGAWEQAAKEYGVTVDIQDSYILDARVVGASEMLNAAAEGAVVVSESAKEAKEAIATQDIGSLARVEAKMADMEKEMKALRERLYVDNLTKAKNRTWMAENLIKDGCIVSSGVMSFIDMREFKLINDRYGHIAGDNALTFIAREFMTAMPEATFIRYGGDEFVLFMPNMTSESQINEVLMALKNSIKTKPLYVRGEDNVSFHVDFSFGTTAVCRGEHLHEIIERSDRIMYTQKINEKLEESAEIDAGQLLITSDEITNEKGLTP